jgi:hypothetical protein
MGGTHIGSCRKWVGRGFQTFETDEQKKSFGFQYTFLPLNLLIFFGVHAKTSASSKFLSQKCMCAFVVAGGGGVPPTPLCKNIQCHIICLYVLVLEVC